jgi:hypothetical protein
MSVEQAGLYYWINRSTPTLFFDRCSLIEEEAKKEEPPSEIITIDNYFINNKEIS